jgi:heme/copper-type cytochrome/quinol oxidase subunit 1
MLSSLLIAINMIMVAVDWAASKISFERSPLLVVPVTTQKLSLMPRQVSGIMADAGTGNRA